MKKVWILFVVMCVFLGGCSKVNPPKEQGSSIVVAAAASLKNPMEEGIIPIFQEKYPHIKVLVTYDSSGKLQNQIQEGAEVDVFMSAAVKQMEALEEQGLIKENTKVPLLENKVVLIVPKGSKIGINRFEEVVQAENIAVGDPESVPAGQYAKEVFDHLAMWPQVASKASFGTNVTQVLHWVAEGSADVGVVYSTDAAGSDKVEVVAEAPKGSVSKVIYPIGILENTINEETAKIFVDFLSTKEAMEIFENFGFQPYK